MGKEKANGKVIGWDDWDKIVQSKEASLKVINANYRNLYVGEIIEKLVLKTALIERNKYPEPPPDTMEEEEKKDEKPEEEDTEESTDNPKT